MYAACFYAVVRVRRTYLKPYAGVTASKTADVSSMIEYSVLWEGFAADLGVVSVDDSENGIDSRDAFSD